MYLARIVQGYYAKNAGVTLNIIDDSTEKVSKEILIGNTERYHTSLTEREYAVTLKGSALVFEGGHKVTLEKAVKRFIMLNYLPGHINQFSGRLKDFELAVTLDGDKYSYIWGDEFDGNTLDTTKFSYAHSFGSGYKNGNYFEYPVRDTGYSKVENGLLKMTAVMDAYGNIKNAKAICTGENMWFLHGYLEMRAKIPLKHGAWPSWWATDCCKDVTLFDISKREYFTEIDFFESFGSDTGMIESNVHKWYSNYFTETAERNEIPNSFLHPVDSDGNEVTHSERRVDSLYNNNIITESDEYHTFGFQWTADKMVMLLDGKVYAAYDLNDPASIDTYSDNTGFKNNPIHLIFGNWLILEGCFGGESGSGNAVISDFPIEYAIDYIRLYQKNGDAVYNIGF